MKKVYLTLFILLFLSSTFKILMAQTCPPPEKHTGANPSSGTFYGQVTLDLETVSNGDIILAYDPDGNVAGSTNIIVSQNIAYINLIIYGDDTATPLIDEGMGSGDTYFTLKVFDVSKSTYYELLDFTNSIVQFTQWGNYNGSPIPAYSDFNLNYTFSENDSLEINNTIPNGTYEVSKEIISAGIVVSGTEVNFHAGQSILLSPNFTVNGGAEFTAKILTPCSSSMPITPVTPLKNQAKLLTETETIIEPTLKISPNPFSDQSKIELNLPEKDVVNITVFDQTGRKIKALVENKILEKGKYVFQLKDEQWPEGMLFINMTTIKTQQVKKAILIKNNHR